jgi:tetratricopeptide (TPR) repeat protein
MRARFVLGRAAAERGEHPLALERLAAASRLATDLGNEYYQGRIAHARGMRLLALGEYSAAERRLAEAVELLARTENYLHRAGAQVSLGNLLCELGRFDEAYDLLASAELRDAAAPVGADPRSTRLAMAKALLGLGRYDEAVGSLEGLLELDRAVGDRAGELEALRLLARAELGRANVPAAESAAAAAVAVAAREGTAADALDARLLHGRVCARLARADVPDELRAVMADVDAAGDDVQRAEVRLYLAEALALESPIESAELVAEVREMPIVEATPWLGHELERVDRERLRAPVRVNPDGTLVVDTRLGWPSLKQARETLERYLLEGALTQTRGNAAAAGRLIGETRYQMHYLRRIFERGQGRPSRGRIADEEDGTERARRSASRPKRLVRRKG